MSPASDPSVGSGALNRLGETGSAAPSYGLCCGRCLRAQSSHSILGSRRNLADRQVRPHGQSRIGRREDARVDFHDRLRHAGRPRAPSPPSALVSWPRRWRCGIGDEPDTDMEESLNEGLLELPPGVDLAPFARDDSEPGAVAPGPVECGPGL